MRVFVQQQEEPDDDENVMDLEALKSRTTHFVSFAAGPIMIFKKMLLLLIIFGSGVDIYRFFFV